MTSSVVLNTWDLPARRESTQMSASVGVADQLSVYPAELLEGLTAQPSDRRWWVLYTKVHQEKAIVRQLYGRQIPYFLPLVEKVNICRGRRFVSHVPVFAGYVFLFGTDEERVASLTTNRVSRILVVDDLEQLTYDLRQLQRLIASGAPLTIERRLVPGDRVRVRSGPLTGLEGTVLKRHGSTRLLVAVNLLQQGASVDIDACQLEPIGDWISYRMQRKRHAARGAREAKFDAR
jgi:transcriptional antiterminator RfaH